MQGRIRLEETRDIIEQIQVRTEETQDRIRVGEFSAQDRDD